MILRILTRHGAKGMRIHEIEKKSKLNKTTAMRLTKTLVSENFLVHDARTKTYSLGPESYAVGLAAEPRVLLQGLHIALAQGLNGVAVRLLDGRRQAITGLQ